MPLATRSGGVWAASSRSVLVGVSVLVSVAILVVVVSAAYQLAGERVDPGDPPLIRVSGLPLKLPPDALFETTEPLWGEGEPGAGAPDPGFELRPDDALSAPAAPAEALPAAAPEEAERSPEPASPPAPSTPARAVEYRVQLLATPNETAARRAWEDLLGRFGASLSAYQEHIEKAEVEAGTVYRVQIGPFDALTAAQAKCDELKRQDMSCFALRVRRAPG